MKTLMYGGFSLILILFFGIGCKSKQEIKAEEVTSLNGTYSGTVTYNGQKAAMTMVSSQTATQVSGTYTISGAINENGNISGTVIGLIYSFTLRRLQPVIGNFSGSVDLSNGDKKITGTYGNGAYTFELTRQ